MYKIYKNESLTRKVVTLVTFLRASVMPSSVGGTLGWTVASYKETVTQSIAPNYARSISGTHSSCNGANFVIAGNGG